MQYEVRKCVPRRRSTFGDDPILHTLHNKCYAKCNNRLNKKSPQHIQKMRAKRAKSKKYDFTVPLRPSDENRLKIVKSEEWCHKLHLTIFSETY